MQPYTEKPIPPQSPNKKIWFICLCWHIYLWKNSELFPPPLAIWIFFHKFSSYFCLISKLLNVSPSLVSNSYECSSIVIGCWIAWTWDSNLCLSYICYQILYYFTIILSHHNLAFFRTLGDLSQKHSNCKGVLHGNSLRSIFRQIDQWYNPRQGRIDASIKMSLSITNSNTKNQSDQLTIWCLPFLRLF